MHRWRLAVVLVLVLAAVPACADDDPKDDDTNGSPLAPSVLPRPPTTARAQLLPVGVFMFQQCVAAPTSDLPV